MAASMCSYRDSSVPGGLGATWISMIISLISLRWCYPVQVRRVGNGIVALSARFHGLPGQLQPHSTPASGTSRHYAVAVHLLAALDGHAFHALLASGAPERVFPGQLDWWVKDRQQFHCRRVRPAPYQDHRAGGGTGAHQ